MFPIEYASWIDLVLDHYVFSVIISVFLVATTFIISKMNKHSDNCLNICSSDPKSTNECDNSDATAISSLARSPAIIAEKVIEANMTEEQKRLEQDK
nr:uncharacterized protein LOC122269319 isoform X2 [Parasteatoda tepidariorum]